MSSQAPASEMQVGCPTPGSGLVATTPSLSLLAGLRPPRLALGLNPLKSCSLQPLLLTCTLTERIPDRWPCHPPARQFAPGQVRLQGADTAGLLYCLVLLCFFLLGAFLGWQGEICLGDKRTNTQLPQSGPRTQ